MPRFGFDAPSPSNRSQLGRFTSPPSGEEQGTLVPLGMNTPSPAMPRAAGGRSSSSVRLCCSDGSSLFFSLNLKNDSSIETRRLPLQESRENRPDDAGDDVPALIVTALPESIQAALEIDPPLELLCVDRRPKQSSNPNHQVLLPTLGLYTKKSVFLLQLAYTKGSASPRNWNSVTPGTVVSVEEPFEYELMDSMSQDTTGGYNILRVRPALQQSEKSSSATATLCPPKSLAMLVQCHADYRLCLYHPTATEDGLSGLGSGRATTALAFEAGELEDPARAFVDFCFCQSRGLGLLASLSVLLVTQRGDLYCATPIVFDGTIVAKSQLVEVLDYLRDQVAELDRASAKWRQCRAAEQFFLDAFVETQGGKFCKAQLSRGEAVGWPVTMQGPLLFATDESLELNAPQVVALESFGNAMLVGFAIGKESGFVDVGVISPSALIPRFSFEGFDAHDLNESLPEVCAVVDRVSLEQKTTRTDNPASFALVPDPVFGTLLHYVCETSVSTISTDAVAVASRTVSRQTSRTASPPESTRTTAWSSLKASDSMIQGIAVSAASRDSSSGHELTVQLAKGTMVPVNVTEAQCLREVEAAIEAASSARQNQLLLTNGPSVTDEALRAMDSTQPLADLLEPLRRRIESGLAGLGKIVGSETEFKDISPEMQAVALQIQTRCDRDVIEPLIELRRVMKKRREKLVVMMKSQEAQLADLMRTMNTLKDRISAVSTQMESAESNALTLSQRSSAVLQACQDLVPQATETELEFFRDLKRLELKTMAMEKNAKPLTESAAEKAESLDEGGAAVVVMTLDEMDVRRANAMLDHLGVTVRDAKQRLDANSEMLEYHRRRLGWTPGS